MESTQLNNLPSEEALFELLTLTCEVNYLGTKKYYNKEGLPHRIYGPAAITNNGSKFWCKNGKYHREDGPAIVFADGEEQYWINGIRFYSKEEYDKNITINNI